MCCSACSGDYENPDRTATDEEVEESVQIQTRIPANPMQPSPEQTECLHPFDKLEFKTYLRVFICGECGSELLLPERFESLEN